MKRASLGYFRSTQNETCDNLKRPFGKHTRVNIRKQPPGLNYYSFTTWMNSQKRCKSLDQVNLGNEDKKTLDTEIPCVQPKTASSNENVYSFKHVKKNINFSPRIQDNSLAAAIILQGSTSFYKFTTNDIHSTLLPFNHGRWHINLEMVRKLTTLREFLRLSMKYIFALATNANPNFLMKVFLYFV